MHDLSATCEIRESGWMLLEILMLPIPRGDIKQCVRGGQGVLRIVQACVTRNSRVEPCWKSRQVKTDISLK